MKKGVWIIVALCAVLVLTISAVAETAGGVYYKTRGSEVWQTIQSGDAVSIETAYLYGTWRNADINLYGAPIINDTLNGTTFDLIMSGDFKFSLDSDNNEHFWVFGGANTATLAEDDNRGSSLYVTGNSSAKIDLNNGGIEFFGGDHCWKGEAVTDGSILGLCGGLQLCVLMDFSFKSWFYHTVCRTWNYTLSV